MFLWQMKFPNTQTPWSILTLSRKKTNIPSCLLSKIKEEVISKYQLSPIMRNRLKYLFYNYQIDWIFYLKYTLASLILFLEIFSLFPVWTENWYLKKGNFYQFRLQLLRLLHINIIFFISAFLLLKRFVYLLYEECNIRHFQRSKIIWFHKLFYVIIFERYIATDIRMSIY